MPFPCSSTEQERPLCGLLPSELTQWLDASGLRSFRGDQILAWMHRRSVLDPAAMTDLPRDLRQRLSTTFPPLEGSVADVQESADGTRKLRVDLAGDACVETVLIPDGNKLTQCLSTQVGCAFRCRFCLSGSRGLDRSLRAEEIIGQVHLARAHLGLERPISNVVIMGSGEPFANYEETVRAVSLLISQRGVGLSTRKVTVSTIGLPAGIARLGRDFGGQIGLAISLHGPDDETRTRLLSRGRAPKTRDLLQALREYPLPKRRRITVEYVLVKGVNDDPSQALALSRRLRGIRVKVNLIPLNEHGATELRSPDPSAVEAFQQTLLAQGLPAILRRPRGADVGAACGQLVPGLGTG